jgi:bifunctional DNase/RNase
LKLVQVDVEKLLFDPDAGVSALVLKEREGDRRLPVWIGHAEALAIAAAIEEIEFSRPMTHDLLNNVTQRLGAKVEWVRVHDVVEGTYLGAVGLRGPQGQVEVDSRPSDAIALALRAEAPVYVNETLFETVDPQTGVQLPTAGDSAEDEDYLANLPDEIFGKYKQ